MSFSTPSYQQQDKVALEEAFWAGAFSANDTISLSIPTNLKKVKANLFISENGWYETESVQNSSFFKRTATGMIPVCESSSPIESVITLLCAYVGDKHYMVDLTQIKYGYQSVRGELALEQLLSYCINMGCKPYVGIESIVDDSITASMFMVNHPQGYCHTFKFEIDKKLLDQNSGTFSATAYTYTPIHNLSK